MNSFHWFFHRETASGNILLMAALVAIGWANSPWKEAYFYLWHIPLTIGIPGFGLTLPLHAWVNDGLMACFFFLVGLEIKRELLVGELANPRAAIMPVMAAVGGMIVPGLLYLFLNPPGGAFFRGWGIPTVTDIAFSLGVLALLGSRVPLFLKVFLTALAIVDDLGAILIIALFYAQSIAWGALGLAGLCFLVLITLNRFGLRWLPAYGFGGVLLWISMLYSGVHPTLAGVLLALTIPARLNTKISSVTLAEDSQKQVRMREDEESELEAPELESPLHYLENTLHPWVTYGIMPLFALANAGVPFSLAAVQSSLAHPIAMGVILGLVGGKQVGIALFSWLSVQLKLTELPEGIRWIQLYGLACLGGIGFTMSLFIAGLAFPGEQQQNIAKIGILVASVLSGVWGWWILRKNLPELGDAALDRKTDS